METERAIESNPQHMIDTTFHGNPISYNIHWLVDKLNKTWRMNYEEPSNSRKTGDVDQGS